jgi:hypothetical protein
MEDSLTKAYTFTSSSKTFSDIPQKVGQQQQQKYTGSLQKVGK